MAEILIGEGQKRIEAILPVLEAHTGFEQKLIPCHSNWASVLGHQCDRYLYYKRHDWEKAKLRDWKGIGERGKLIEQWWKNHMTAKGFKVFHDNIPLTDDLSRKYRIGGRIDGRIGWKDLKPVLYEFKTVSDHHYEKINTYEDIVNSKFEWIRMYPSQIQIYLISCNEESGLFILCNPVNLEWKAIPVYLDLEYCEWLLKRAERINKAIETDSPPNRITYGRTCERCDFARICLPDIVNEGRLDIVDEPHIVEILNERQNLKPSKDRYEELDEEAKFLARAHNKDFIAGPDWKIELKRNQKTRVDISLIPVEDRTKYEITKEEVRVNFIPLKHD